MASTNGAATRPGFQLQPRTAVMEFEDGPLQGLEVRVRLSVPLAFYYDLVDRFDRNKTADFDLEQMRLLMADFAKHAIVSWNFLDAEGQPVPCTPEAFAEHMPPFEGGILLGKYLDSIGSVAAPLRRRSSGGGRSAKPRARQRRSS